VSWAARCAPGAPRAGCDPPCAKVAGGEGGARLPTWVEAAVRARDEAVVVALLVPPSSSTRSWVPARCAAGRAGVTERKLRPGGTSVLEAALPGRGES
jgi:hypothetical protein